MNKVLVLPPSYMGHIPRSFYDYLALNGVVVVPDMVVPTMNVPKEIIEPRNRKERRVKASQDRRGIAL